MKTHKTLHIITWINLAIILVGFVLIGYWGIYPFKTFEANNQPYKIINKEIKAGELLQYEADYCRLTDVTANITRRFVNDLIYEMPSTVNQAPEGCYKDIITIKVPSELPPGKYNLSMIYVYSVSPLQKITRIAETEEFIVK
jgi:hypothetical protein